MVDKLIVYSNSSSGGGGGGAPIMRFNQIVVTNLAADESEQESVVPAATDYIFPLRDLGGVNSVKYKIAPGYGNLDETINAFDVSNLSDNSIMTATLYCRTITTGANRMTFFMRAINGRTAHSSPVTTVVSGNFFGAAIHMLKNNETQIQLGVNIDNANTLILFIVLFEITEGK